jgi:hypothetical protein
VRFIWVNGRRPSSQSACAFCSQPIGAAYVRHIEMRRCYCDPDCYAFGRPDNSRISPVTPQEAGAILESALMVLHNGENGLAY